MGYRVFTGGAGSTAYVEDCPRSGPPSCNTRPAGTLIFVGDDRGNRMYRALVSFNTAGLPDHAIVTAVKLKMKSAGIAGTNPINARRALSVEICPSTANPEGGHPGVVPPSSASCSPAGTFANSPNSGWYTADLLPSSYSSVSLQGATTVHILLAGTPAHDFPRAYIRFFAPDASESDSPVLLVKYHLP